MKWLIHYRYTAIYYFPDGRNTSVGPSDGHALSNVHPAKFNIHMILEFDRIKNAPREDRSMIGDRADMLHCIYCAIEVPPGTLTPEEEDTLS